MCTTTDNTPKNRERLKSSDYEEENTQYKLTHTHTLVPLRCFNYKCMQSALPSALERPVRNAEGEDAESLCLYTPFITALFHITHTYTAANTRRPNMLP